LRLADEVLADIELGRLASADVARKTSRLARLLDDIDALEWLHFEIAGYPGPEVGGLTESAVAAARRSNRLAEVNEQGHPLFWTASLAALDAEIAAARTALSKTTDTAIVERNTLRATIQARGAIVHGIVGAFHEYASARYQELRFGGAVATAFEIVRAEVDGAIASLVPDALPKLSAAFEDATSQNPDDWARAAATCGRLLEAAADALHPPGPDDDRSKPGDEHYVNRLIDWIVGQPTSKTGADTVSADLERLGRRLDAALGVWNKGGRAELTRFDASRLITDTYLLLGDVLRLGGTSR